MKSRTIESSSDDSTTANKKALDPQAKAELCASIEKPGARITFTGITRSFLALLEISAMKGENLTLVTESGNSISIGGYEECSTSNDATGNTINIKSDISFPPSIISKPGPHRDCL
jgi:hypothetical protein